MRTAADNLDIGHRREAKLIFSRQVLTNTRREVATEAVAQGSFISVNAFHKHSRFKEYLKQPSPAGRNGG